MLPDRKHDSGYAEGKLVQFYLPELAELKLHDALNDVKALKALLDRTGMDDQKLKAFCNNLRDMKQSKVVKQKSAKVKST